MTTPTSLLTNKQLRTYREATARINIAHGSVRSGKSVGLEQYKWLQYVRTAPPGDLLMAARTLKTLERNVLRPMQELFGTSRIVYSIGKKEATICGRRVELEGGNDQQAEAKIRGMTLAGALINEATLVPETFFKQILARMSVPGAKLFATTNPDSPNHWLKKGFLDREQELKENGSELRQWHFALADNTFLDQGYVASLAAEYTGLWHKRFILGQWVAAEGAVYDMFDEDLHVVDKLPPIIRYWVGIDYGTSNQTVFVLIGQGRDDCLYVCREYVWDSREKGKQKTDKEYAEDFVQWLRTPFVVAPAKVYPDPSAASFSLQLVKEGVKNIVPADNTVVDGIRNVSTLLSASRLKIHASCKHSIAGFYSYVWDTKAQGKGEDKPVKDADHTCDSIRYCIRMIRSVWLPWVQREEAQRKLELLPHQIA